MWHMASMQTITSNIGEWQRLLDVGPAEVDLVFQAGLSGQGQRRPGCAPRAHVHPVTWQTCSRARNSVGPPEPQPPTSMTWSPPAASCRRSKESVTVQGALAIAVYVRKF
jgi:hypothetical protein